VNENQTTHSILGAVIEVHKTLGPGLLESAYEECLAREIGEETGLAISSPRLLGIHNSAGPYLQMIFACDIGDDAHDIRLRPHEHIESRWISLTELAQLEMIPYLEGILRRGMLDFVATTSRG